MAFLRVLPSQWFFLQLASSVVLTSFSDVICQFIVEHGDAWDHNRTARFTFVGAFLMSPLVYVWLNLLDGIQGGTVIPTGVKRMLVDQTVGSPLFTSLFLFLINFVESAGNASFATDKVSEQLLPLLVTNYKVWPLVQVLNMSVVPLQLRAIVAQVVGFFWGIYMSYATN